MSSKKKPSLSPRKLFETEELPHFGFYSYSSPPDFENIPSNHKNILLWIGQYAATYDLEKVVQALTDSFEGMWNFDSEVYGRVMLSALGVFARSQNFKLGQEAIKTLTRIDSAKQHPSYHNFLRELKIQIALATVRDDHKKTVDFSEAIREISDKEFGEDQETVEELVQFGRLLKSKHGGNERIQQINNYFAKHSVDRFQKEVLQFLKDVKEAQPPPYLEIVEKDVTAGKYKPDEAERTYSYKEIEAAYLEDGGSNLGEIFAQQDPAVADYVKKKSKQPKQVNNKKTQKQKPAPNKIAQSEEEEEEEEEPLTKKKKQKKDVAAITPTTAAKQLETRETLTQLDHASKKLFAHGKDPLSEARRKAPKKVNSASSSKETTPHSRPTSANSSAANSADKGASLLDRRATAQAVEWNNSDEDLEEDEFMDIEEHILNTPKRLLEKRELNQPELISPPGGKTVRRRIKWTTEEEDKLLEGYIRYPLQWARIKRKFNFTGRTGVDLKDKYRNMMKHYDDTQRRVEEITRKINEQKLARIAKGLEPDEPDSEVEKKRQKERGKKSKRFYDSEPEAAYEEEEEEEEEPPVESDSDSGKKKRPRRRSSEAAKKRIKSSQEVAEEEEEEEEEEDLNKTVEEEPEEDENDKPSNQDSEEDETEEKTTPEPKKKTVKKTRRRRRRY